MNWPTVALGDVSRPRQWSILARSEMADDGFPVFGANGLIGFSNKFTHHQPTVVVGCRGTCGAVHLTNGPTYVNGNAMAIDELDEGRIEPNFLAHFLRWRGLADVTTGSSQPQITRQNLVRVRIPAPPLPEQRRIASVLDGSAEGIARALAETTTLRGLRLDLFRSSFGDYRTSLSNWTQAPLGDLSIKYSDGPFGSNLASKHYETSGTRVVRLQNIGVFDFDGRDAAFINDAHALTLEKHRCVPGDVLIGTLGEPNLRACQLPQEVPAAINKADCVQFRADLNKVEPEYIVGFLNDPSVVKAASSLVLGQTRGRISMGRLRGFSVPVPPITIQRAYVDQLAAIEKRLVLTQKRVDLLAELRESLMNRAFRGEL